MQYSELMPWNNPFSKILDSLPAYGLAGYRAIVHVSGAKDFCALQAEELIRGSGFERVVWLGSPEVSAYPPAQIKKLLGTEIDLLVINAFEGLNPCALGIASGCIRAGGLLVLLSPEKESWVNYPDPDYLRMVSYDSQLPLIKGRFIRHLINSLAASPDIWHIDADGKIALPDSIPHGCFVRNYHEQQAAIGHIKHVVTGHARRPLVLQADRGRGKTAALGMAAAELMRERNIDIIVTAPGLDAVQTLFFHAAKVLGFGYHQCGTLLYQQSSLVFIPADRLLAEEHKASLLIVDEAAAIPSSMLESLLERFNRVVFSTTVDGYEGSGRGFNIRFCPVIARKMPQWRLLEIEEPIRWARGDPLEILCNSMLLLKTVPARISTSKEVAFSWIDRDELLHNRYRLEQIFGLLVNAHYQTSPDDLRILLDHPDVSIAIGEQQGDVVAVALLMKEGGFDLAACPGFEPQKLKEGRRIRGHLLPQSLAVSGISQQLTSLFYRVLRIAVQADLQCRGVGKKLVAYIESSINAEYLGACFSAESGVVRFWQKTGMQVVKLGIHKESSTGQYACIVLKDVGTKKGDLLREARSFFSADIGYQLLALNHDMQPATVLQILKGLPAELVARDLDQCRAYIDQQRSFETVQSSLYRVFYCHACNNSAVSQYNNGHRLMIEKLLLNHSWNKVSSRYGYTGRKSVEKMLRAEFSLLLA